jgi:hypothetical protein
MKRLHFNYWRIGRFDAFHTTKSTESIDDFIRQFNAWCVAKSYDINLAYEYIPADYKFQLRNKK